MSIQEVAPWVVGVAMASLATLGLAGVASAQPSPAQPAAAQPAPAPPSTAPAPPPPDGGAGVAAPPPEAWFPQVQEPPSPAGPSTDARQPDGAYVVEPAEPSSPPPLPDDPAYDAYENREGALLMGMFAVRPFVTSIDADGAGASEDPTGIVAGHVGMRAHGTGISEDLILRFDLEAFVGASTEGVEGEGRGFLSFGLAAELEGPNFLMFRFGAGGAMFGNPKIDFQVADLPALELGYVHVGADGFIEIAPRVAMAVSRMAAFDTGLIEPDPAPAAGGRLLAGGDSLWGTLDYEVISGDQLMHLGLLTACFAQKFSFCLDGRLASASLAFRAEPGTERVTAISGGLSFGLGLAEQER